MSGSSSLPLFLFYYSVKSQSLGVEVKSTNLNLCGLSWIRIPALLSIDEETIDKLLNLSKLLVYSYHSGENSTYVSKKK